MLEMQNAIPKKFRYKLFAGLGKNLTFIVFGSVVNREMVECPPTTRCFGRVLNKEQFDDQNRNLAGRALGRTA